MSDWMHVITDVFQYSFMQRALIVGILIAISSSMLGVFLVLKKFSMIGDGLAHVSFATVAIALLLNQSSLIVSIPVVMLASILILKMNESASVYGDAAIGLVSSFSVALGILITSVSQGFNVDLFSFMFGSILVIGEIDVWLSLILSAIVVFTIVFFYHDLFAVTYDEAFAKVIGIKTKRMNYLIAMLTAITIVLGIRAVGTMLISSMIIFPAVTALQFSRNFKWTIAIATFVSLISVVVGIIGSYWMDWPSGASIVMVNAVFFTGAFIYKLAR